MKKIKFNKNDVVYTPRDISKKIVEYFKPTGKILDPCMGDGAGMAINGVNNTREWYLKNKENIKLNKFTRHIVETCLNCCLINPLK